MTEENHPSPGTQSSIGESVVIVGEIKGKEDIVIDGSIDGDVNFREHDITIGKSGHIKANVTAKNIIIAGDVTGELRASEQITIKHSGKVSGDIHAPRVALNDGCQFKGAVDMEELNVAADNRTSKLRLPGSPLSREHPLKTAKKLGKP